MDLLIEDLTATESLAFSEKVSPGPTVICPKDKLRYYSVHEGKCYEGCLSYTLYNSSKQKDKFVFIFVPPTSNRHCYIRGYKKFIKNQLFDFPGAVPKTKFEVTIYGK